MRQNQYSCEHSRKVVDAVAIMSVCVSILLRLRIRRLMHCAVDFLTTMTWLNAIKTGR